MQRRTLLGAVGTALTATLAGCSDMNPLAEDEPETYSQDEEDALLFDEARDEWPDEMERDDSINENFDRGFVNQDETVIVLMHVDIYEDIETAENELEKSRARASNDEDYPIADDGFIADDGESAQVIFRHRNANGQTLAIRESGGGVSPDRNRASEYADLLFEYWEDNG